MITAESTAADVQKIIFEKLDPVHGPVFINGAKPGDVLQIDVVKLECAPWGWTGLIPGFGLLADEMKEADIRIWKLDNENMCTYFDYTGKDGKPRKIKIPLKPFAGEMGMALAKPGAHSTIPPYRTGGNMDVKHMGVGSRVFLPIEVEGGLFSVGVSVNLFHDHALVLRLPQDGHAVQGDGGKLANIHMDLSLNSFPFSN
jgi:acetamidase/formamidase